VQRKLDEILRVLPGADTRLVHVEAAAQAELNALEERHLGDWCEAARSADPVTMDGRLRGLTGVESGRPRPDLGAVGAAGRGRGGS